MGRRKARPSTRGSSVGSLVMSIAKWGWLAVRSFSIRPDSLMIVRKSFLFSRWLGILLVAVGLWAFEGTARGVLLFRTGDPAANTTEPTGALAGSGWQYQGNSAIISGPRSVRIISLPRNTLEPVQPILFFTA